MDQGGEWETEFIAVLEQFGILSRVTGAYAPWQNSLAERHGAILGTAWMTLIHDYKVDSRPMMKMTLTCALQAKNQTVTRRGYSAEALVFGSHGTAGSSTCRQLSYPESRRRGWCIRKHPQRAYRL